MVLQLVEGCVNDALTVDGIQEYDLTNNQRIKVIDKISTWMKEHPECLNYVLQTIVPQYGEYYSDGIPCDCCGDITREYTLKI